LAGDNGFGVEERQGAGGLTAKRPVLMGRYPFSDANIYRVECAGATCAVAGRIPLLRLSHVPMLQILTKPRAFYVLPYFVRTKPHA